MNDVVLTCEHCGRNRMQHREAENAGQVNHKFSEDGSLTPSSTRQEPSGQQAEAPGAPVPPSDPVLRLLLVEKGLVTGAELDEMTQRLRHTGLVVVPDAGDGR